MKKECIYLLLITICLSCNKKIESKNDIEVEKITSINEESKYNDMENNDFEKYLTNFKYLPIEKYELLNEYFYEFLNEEYSNVNKAITENELKKYLKNINYNKEYNLLYGFKTKLDSNTWFLVYYLHSDQEIPSKKGLTDVTIFKLCLYNLNGDLLDNIDIIGADMSDEETTYNFSSSFTNVNDKINISTTEYYYDIDHPYTDDSILEGKIRHQNYFYNNLNKKFVYLNSTVEDAKLIYSLNKYNLGYIKKID